MALTASAVTIQYKPVVAQRPLEMLSEAERKERLTLSALQVLEFVAIVFSIYYQPVVGLALLVTAAYFNDSLRETVRRFVHHFFFPQSVITDDDRTNPVFSYLYTTLEKHLSPLNQPVSDVTAIEDIAIDPKAKYLAFYGKDDLGRLFFLMRLHRKAVTNNNELNPDYTSFPIAIYYNVMTKEWNKSLLFENENIISDFRANDFIQPVSLSYEWEGIMGGSPFKSTYSLLPLNQES